MTGLSILESHGMHTHSGNHLRKAVPSTVMRSCREALKTHNKLQTDAETSLHMQAEVNTHKEQTAHSQSEMDAPGALLHTLTLYIPLDGVN